MDNRIYLDFDNDNNVTHKNCETYLRKLLEQILYS